MILFITRKYPPSIGGMQKLSYELTTRMGKIGPVCIIAWGGSQIFLPLFLPYAFFQATLLLLRKPIQVVHIGDPVLSPLGVMLRALFGVATVVTVHGLDVTFPNRFYRGLVSACLRRMDLIICISEYTRQQCMKLGMPADLCRVIGVGVEVEGAVSAPRQSPGRLGSLLDGNLAGKKVLLSVGRLVKRKGILDFITYVLPALLERSPQIHYLIVGQGPERRAIECRLRELGLEEKVSLLDQVDDATLREIYLVSDLFVMPNIPVQGDAEGFGVVALEASAAGLWVVASRVDGIPDAVREGENGFLIEPGDKKTYVEVISSLLTDEENRARLGKRAREYVSRTYSWDDVIAEYRHEFEQLITGRRNDAEEPTYGEAKR